MFRFFRRDNLKSTRRRSASCPNLEQAYCPEKNKGDDPGEAQGDLSQGSESESEGNAPASKFERLKAQRSIRRVRQKEKEKKEKSEKNLLSMDDYLGKLSELKTWLTEERKKDVDSMKSPKMKAYFKTFIKLWNKRKLPMKYYRSCSVDLGQEEDPPVSPVFPDVMEQPTAPQYPLVENPATPSMPIFPPPLDLSSANMFENADSPFSTFGKSPGDPLTSPAHLAEQVNVTSSVFSEGVDSATNKGNSKPILECGSGSSSSSSSRVISPQKFATISRSTPSSNLYKFTAQPWSAKGDLKVHPVSSPKCPQVEQGFDASKILSGPSSKTLPRTFAPGAGVNQDVDKLVAGWNYSTRQSPIYSAVVDSIPFNTGSPEYAEIDEALPSAAHNGQVSSVYCSLSPLAGFTSSNLKQAVKKNPSLNRRRSKSMEDIYAVPVRTDIFRVRRPNFMEEVFETSKAPPIPEKLFSPKSLYSTFSGERNAKTHSPITSPSFSSSLSPMKSSYDYSPQKRRSQESMEGVQQNNSPEKKVKSNTLSSFKTCSNVSLSTVDRDESNWNIGTPTSQETMTPTKLSNLTGSLQPTTRSRHREKESWKSPCSDDLDLSLLEVQELKESPKFPRRKLKRRSSSLTTTPGKGLTFGKSFKKSTASPRRVSFAKDVKDTESRSTPRRKSSSRYGPNVNPGNFCRQTQERVEFESFLSSHASPPKTKNSPSTSPDKNSTSNSASHSNGVKKNLARELRSARKADTCQENSLVHGSAVSKNDQVRVNYMQPTASTIIKAVNKDRIFPPSPVKQVGRRIIGAPSSKFPQKPWSPNATENSPHTTMKREPHHENSDSHHEQSKHPKGGNSPQRNLINQLKQLSPQKKLFGSQSSFSLPRKPIHSLVSRLGEKTSALCASEVEESNSYVSYDDLINPMEPAKPSDRSILESNSEIPSETSKFALGPISKVCPMTVEKVMTPQVQTAESEIVRVSTPQFVTTFSIGKDPSMKLLSETSDNDKDSAGSFQMLELNHSPGSKRKSERQDIETDSLSTATFSQNKTNQEKSSCNQPTEISNTNISAAQTTTALKTVEGELSTLTPHKQGVKVIPIAHCHTVQKSSELTSLVDMPKLPACTETQSDLTPVVKPQLPYLNKDISLLHSDTCAKDILAANPCLVDNRQNDRENHFHTNDPSFDSEMKAFEKEADLFNQSLGLNTLSSVKGTPIKCDSHAPGSSTQKVGITRPSPNPNVSIHKQTATSTSKSSYKPVDRHESIASSEIQRKEEYPQKGNKSSSRKDSHSTKTTKDSETNSPKDCSSKEKEGSCSLQRLESIKASPKIVDNDGWITERRRSSRGKAQHSFRSAHNRFLLRSASKDKEEKEEQKKEKDAEISSDPRGVYEPDPVSANDDPDTDTKSQVDSVNSSEMPHVTDGSLDNIKNKPTTQPTHQLHSTLKTTAAPSPLKKKPAVLPKTVKVSTLARKRLNINQFVNAASEPKPRRRSSLAAKENLRRESVGKKQNRRESNESVKQHRRESQETKGRQGSNVRPENGRISGGPRDDFIKRNISAVRRDSSTLTQAPSKWSQYQQAGHMTKKRSSIGDSSKQKNRRRSKGKNTEDENKIPSFSERRKFFQQLQTETETSPRPQQFRSAFTAKSRQSPEKQSFSPVQRGQSSSVVNGMKTSPLKTLQPEYKDKRQLTLSPNSGMNI